MTCDRLDNNSTECSFWWLLMSCILCTSFSPLIEEVERLACFPVLALTCFPEQRLQFWKNGGSPLLAARGRDGMDYPTSVLKTFHLSWEHVQQRTALAGIMLQFFVPSLLLSRSPFLLIRMGITQADVEQKGKTSRRGYSLAPRVPLLALNTARAPLLTVPKQT
jgi:hypothetical protein